MGKRVLPSYALFWFNPNWWQLCHIGILSIFFAHLSWRMHRYNFCCNQIHDDGFHSSAFCVHIWKLLLSSLVAPWYWLQAFVCPSCKSFACQFKKCKYIWYWSYWWLYQPSESTSSEPVTYCTVSFPFFTVYHHVNIHRLNKLLFSFSPMLELQHLVVSCCSQNSISLWNVTTTGHLWLIGDVFGRTSKFTSQDWSLPLHAKYERLVLLHH